MGIRFRESVNMLEFPINGKIKTGYNYSIKTEFMPEGAGKGSGEYLCQDFQSGQSFFVK